MDTSIKWMNEWGHFGVAIFLMISCWFLVDLEKVEIDFSLQKYLKKKIRRLWPCYAISISLIYIILHIWYLPERMSSAVDFLLNICFVNGFLSTNYIDGSHWYLTVLLSLIVIIGIARKYKLQSCILFYMCWLALSVVIPYTGVPVIGAILGNGYGCYICLTVAIKGLLQKNNGKNKIGWSCLLLMSIVAVFRLLGIYSVIQLVVIIPLLLGCIYEKCIFLKQRWLIYVGKISYPLYLIHQNIAFEIEYKLMQIYGKYRYLYGVLAVIVVLFLAVILSRVEIHIFERKSYKALS